MRPSLWLTTIVISFAFISVPAHSFVDANGTNTISVEDEGKLIKIWERVLDFSTDLPQVMLGVAKSGRESDADTRRTIYCIQRIEATARVMERDLYGATIAAQMSSALQYRLDERLTLDNVKSALEQAATYVTAARGELNQILGGCGRQSQLSYDKTTSLLRLFEEVGKVVSPMLQRVTASLQQPN